MLFPTFFLAFFVVISLLGRDMHAYAFPLFARSLIVFTFPATHVGPVPTPTGQSGSVTIKTPLFTTHITQTVTVLFSTPPSQESSSHDISTGTKSEATLTLGGSSDSTGATTMDMSEVTGVYTRSASNPANVFTSSISSATTATASGMSQATVYTSIGYSESRHSVVTSLWTTNTRSVSVTKASQVTSSTISSTPSVTPTSLPAPPPKPAVSDISKNLGITFGVTVIVVALVLWFWLVVLPKSKARKAKTPAAKESRARQQKWGNWIRADRARPWVGEPRPGATEELGLGPSTRSGSVLQFAEPTPRGTSVGSWPLRNTNESAETETIPFPVQPLLMDRLDFRRRVRALEEVAENISRTLGEPAGPARGASTDSSSSGPTQASIVTSDTEFSGPRVAGVPANFQSPYLSSNRHDEVKQASKKRKIQRSPLRDSEIREIWARPVSPLSEVGSLRGLSDVSSWADVDLN